jgi:hypothetical protein
VWAPGAEKSSGFVLGKSRIVKAAPTCSYKEEAMNAKDKPYCELGKMLDDLARERDVRGPYNIAQYVQSLTGYEVSGQMVSQYMYGRSFPKREFIKAFAEAFELTPQARGRLAWVYAFDSRPEHERLAIVELKRSSDRVSKGYQEM